MSSYVPEVRPMSRLDIECAAEGLLRSHAPDRLTNPGPVDVVKLVDDYMAELESDGEDVRLSVEPMAPGEEGALHPNGVLVLSEDTYLGATKGLPRPRYTVAHETGHLALHRKQMRRAFIERTGVSFFRRGDRPLYVDPEWQANAYAAALLMPAAVVAKLVAKFGPGIASCVVSDELRVSASAAQYRVKDFVNGKLRVK